MYNTINAEKEELGMFVDENFMGFVAAFAIVAGYIFMAERSNPQKEAMRRGSRFKEVRSGEFWVWT